jgi:signal transduction histidine kinase
MTAPAPTVRRPLFRKYVGLFVAVVSVALLANGALEIWFSYQEHKTSLIRIQREQAEAAAAKIGQFVKEIESQLGWTTQLPWSASTVEQRRFDGLRLLRQVPAITELSMVDATGKEQLRVSRLAMDVIGSGLDLSREPKFTETVARKVYYGPVYFRRESEPYMTLALAGTRRDAGVSIAEVNLKLIWEVISKIKVGERGHAYVVDAQGRLIAHPDISLVLRNTDMSGLTQVRAARAGEAGAAEEIQVAENPQGRPMLTAHAPVAPLGWLVFVEMPLDEAYAPLYASIQRTGVLMLGALVLAAFAGLFLARKMIVPIRTLRAGAERIGGGDLTQRIAVRTGDEFEALAHQFNDMAGRLQESYADLEKKVELRTRELAEALQQQTATADVLKVISNSLTDTQPVFDAIVQSGLKLFSGAAVSIALPDGGEVKAVAVAESNPSRAEAWRGRFPFPLTRDYLHGLAILDRAIVDIPDVQDATTAPETGRRNFLGSGYRAVTIMPMMRGETAIGALSVVRVAPGPLSEKQLATLRTFASQAVIAIENTRLLNELRARTDELAQSVAELRALGEVSRAVNSTLDLETVLSTIVAKAVQLSRTEAGAIYVYSNLRKKFRLRATYGMSDELIQAVRGQVDRLGDTAVGEAVAKREPLQVPDLRDEPSSPVHEIILEAGYRGVLIVPLLRPGSVVGALVVRRKQPGLFPKDTIDLLTTFAEQSVLAIQNARLFSEIEEKGRQLEIASRHKSQFLANMSHELRTPMNSVLGFTEMLADGLYGDLPARAKTALEKVQSNGRHLLGLINDVLDLSKIEAGQLALTLDEYSMTQVVSSVVTSTESLARAKGLALTAAVAPGLPIGRGDERRLTQVLINLVGNAVKFTDAGSVDISAGVVDGFFEIAVQDSGPGIAPEDQARIFEEFQQVDDSSTRRKGGTGLGLAISRRIVEMHGGSISVESTPGRGATFRITVPVRAEEQREAA